MSQNRYRQRNSVPIKDMKQAIKFEMTTVEEVVEDLNDTVVTFDQERISSSYGVIKTVSQSVSQSADFIKGTFSQVESEDTFSQRDSDQDPYSPQPRRRIAIDLTPSPQKGQLISQIVKQDNSSTDDFFSSTATSFFKSYYPLWDQNTLGQEITIERRFILKDSQLLQYFIKRLNNQNSDLYFEVPDDNPCLSLAHINHYTKKYRAISHVNDIQNITELWKPAGSPSNASQTSGAQSTKSDKHTLDTLIKHFEKSGPMITRQSSFSMAVQVQLQQQQGCNYLKKAGKKLRLLQAFMKEQNLDSPLMSEDSDQENHLKFKQKHLRQHMNQDKNPKSRYSLTKNQESSEDAEAVTTPVKPPLLNLTMTNSITFDSPDDTDKLLVRRAKQLQRMSLRGLQQKISLRNRIQEIKKELYSLFKDKSNKQRMQLKMYIGGTICTFLLLLVVFFLALIKYGIEKM